MEAVFTVLKNAQNFRYGLFAAERRGPPRAAAIERTRDIGAGGGSDIPRGLVRRNTNTRTRRRR